MENQVDVLVVGAGPVGLLLATELSRDGVNVLLVDSRLERSFFCRALGITPRTLEIFDDLGFVQDAVDRGVWLRGISTYADGELVTAVDVPRDLPYGSLSLAQFETERLLEACLHRHGGAVLYGQRLIAFEEESEGVRATLEGVDGQKNEVQCRWLVGCDGAHSMVRSLLDLSFEGGQYPQTFVLADLEVKWPLPRGRAYRFNHGTANQSGGRSLMAVPVHDAASERYRLSTIMPDSSADQRGNTGESGSPTLEEISAIMTPLLPEGTQLSDLHWSSIYRVSHRIVEDYSRGRIFLAGDAAHVHPPVGGQGMNTGLQDAHNLAWKLVLASRNLAPPSLLESYSAERRPVGLDVVENTSRALNEVIAQRAPQPGMRETQLLITYRNSSIVKDVCGDALDGAVGAGDRAPDAGLHGRPFVQQPFRLHNLIGHGRHVLLGFFSEDDLPGVSAFAEMLEFLRLEFGELACGFALTPGNSEALHREGVPLLFDAGGQFSSVYSALPGMIWLIRPDGYIGWCSSKPSFDGLRSYIEALVAPSGK